MSKISTAHGRTIGQSFALELRWTVNEDLLYPCTIHIHLSENGGRMYSASSSLPLSAQDLNSLRRTGSTITFNSRVQESFSRILSTLCWLLISWMRTDPKTLDS